MPRRKRELPAGLTEETLDALVAGVRTQAEFDVMFRGLKQAITERILRAELTEHLGYREGEARPAETTNARNGTTPKTLLTESGALPLEIPRDRESSFAPLFVPKGVRRLPGFDQKVLSLYARGLTVRELQAHLEECYAVPVSADLITAVTDEVRAEVEAWQQRPLEPVYVAVAFDALRLKIRDEGLVQHKAVYLALGTTATGAKDILGCWIAQTEGAAFWQRVMTELQGRGVRDILIALIDGLTGFPAAIAAVFPETVIHQCVVHLVRQSLTHVGWKERKAVAAELRAIYQAPSEAAARAALEAFAASPLGRRHPLIAPLWQRHWERIAPALAYPLPVRRLLYSTNAIESLHRTLRKSLKIRGHFPNDEAASKLLYLALRNAVVHLGAPKDWKVAMQHITLLFGDRVPTSE
ncbi:MAG TPA: IS256 family transposase [Gemmatimonadaceae bacterium]|nr:IS256 family transposase [Gemmatimonadaceae bacterium]